MSNQLLRRYWNRLLLSTVAIAGVGAFAITRPVPAAKAMPTRSTTSFGEEAVLGWHDDGTTPATDLLAVKGRSLAKAIGMEKETVYGWNNGVTNAFAGDFVHLG